MTQPIKGMTQRNAALNVAGGYANGLIEFAVARGADRRTLYARANIATDSALWLIDQRTDPNAFPELTESTFARMICGPRRFASNRRVGAVHVTHAEPAYGAEYQRIFQAPVVFGSRRNALQLDASWLTQRVALQPTYVFGILSEHAQRLLHALEHSTTVRSRVERLLLPVLHTRNPDMSKIAAPLGVSRQTLDGTKSQRTTQQQPIANRAHAQPLPGRFGKLAKSPGRRSALAAIASRISSV